MSYWSRHHTNMAVLIKDLSIQLRELKKANPERAAAFIYVLRRISELRGGV